MSVMGLAWRGTAPIPPQPSDDLALFLCDWRRCRNSADRWEWDGVLWLPVCGHHHGSVQP